MPKNSSKERGGISTGGSYVRIDKISRLRALFLLAEEEGTPEQIRTLAEDHLQFSDEKINQWLQSLEFERAAEIAFPQHAPTICDLHLFAIRIATIRRKQSDLRPAEYVKDKLLSDEIPQFYAIRSEYEHGSVPQSHVALRLANIVYYGTQAFAHDLRLATTLHPGSVDALQDAITSYRDVIQRYCVESQLTSDQGTSVRLGFAAAHRKFGMRMLIATKNDTIERLLMDDLLIMIEGE